MAQSGSSWSWAVPVDTEASVTDGGEYPEAKSTDAVIMGVGARFAGGFCKAAGADDDAKGGGLTLGWDAAIAPT